MCKPEIRYTITEQMAKIARGVPDVLINYYVYEWYSEHKPFYIGMGHSRRAWNVHLDHVEELRWESSTFRIRIVRHKLSKTRAHQLERRLIRRRIKQGYSLANKRVPNVNSFS